MYPPSRVLVGVFIMAMFVLPAVTPTRATAAATGPRSATGVITDVSKKTLTLQTREGSITISIGVTTRIIVQTTGSTADLVPSEYLTYHPAPDGSVTWIHILVPPVPAPPHHDTHGPKPGSLHKLPTDTKPPSGREPWPPSPDSRFAHGPVRLVSVSSYGMTVRNRNGRSIYLQIDPDVFVIKDIHSDRDDLALGETVHVQFGRAGNITQLTILSD